MSTDDTRDDSDETSGPSIPEGTYRSRADWRSVSMGWNKARTSKRISVRLRITDPLFPDVIGKSLTWFGKNETQDNRRFAIKDLKAMGWDGESRIAPPVDSEENQNLLGLGGIDCEIVVVHREWEGKVRAEIKYVNALAMGFKDPLNDAEVDDFNASFARDRSPHRPATQYAGRPNQQTPQRAVTNVPQQNARAVRPPAAVTPIRPQHSTIRVDAKAPPTQPFTNQEDEDRQRLERIDSGDDEERIE